MTNDASREAFEVWAKENLSGDLSRGEDGIYTETPEAWAYLGWQACEAQLPDDGEVERVARAIYDRGRAEAAKELGDDLLTFDDAAKSLDAEERFPFDEAVLNAKAAIAALRKPAEAS